MVHLSEHKHYHPSLKSFLFSPSLTSHIYMFINPRHTRYNQFPCCHCHSQDFNSYCFLEKISLSIDLPSSNHPPHQFLYWCLRDVPKTQIYSCHSHVKTIRSLSLSMDQVQSCLLSCLIPLDLFSSLFPKSLMVTISFPNPLCILITWRCREIIAIF